MVSAAATLGGGERSDVSESDTAGHPPRARDGLSRRPVRGGEAERQPETAETETAQDAAIQSVMDHRHCLKRMVPVVCDTAADGWGSSLLHSAADS